MTTRTIEHPATAHQVVVAMWSRNESCDRSAQDAYALLLMPSDGLVFVEPLTDDLLFALRVTPLRTLYILAPDTDTAAELAREWLQRHGIEPTHHVPDPRTGSLVPKYPRLEYVTPTLEYDKRVGADALVKVLTAATEAAYVVAGGTRCPSCGDDDLAVGQPEMDGPTGWQEVQCHGCGATWKDIIELTGIENFTR